MWGDLSDWRDHTLRLLVIAAGLAGVAADSDAVVAEVNPIPTEMSSRFHFSVAGNAGTVLPELVDSLNAP